MNGRAAVLLGALALASSVSIGQTKHHNAPADPGRRARAIERKRRKKEKRKSRRR